MSIVPIRTDNGLYRPVHGTIARPALVLDAAGETGAAIVSALLASGRPVIAAAAAALALPSQSVPARSARRPGATTLAISRPALTASTVLMP